jgi:hypothetical protein
MNEKIQKWGEFMSLEIEELSVHIAQFLRLSHDFCTGTISALYGLNGASFI